MPRTETDPADLRKRLDQIARGITEAIRREVKRLREQGLPVYVERDGKIIDETLQE